MMISLFIKLFNFMAKVIIINFDLCLFKSIMVNFNLSLVIILIIKDLNIIIKVHLNFLLFQNQIIKMCQNIYSK